MSQTVFNAGADDSYDANGNLVHTVDGRSIQRQQSYDALNRLVSTIDNYSGAATGTATADITTTTNQDALDRVTSVTDPSGLVTRYTYDGLGNLTTLQSPDSGTRTTTFDAAGNALTQTDAKGTVATSTYDTLDRPTSTSYSDTTLNIGYRYDEANSVTGCAASSPVGRLTRRVENTVTTTYCYDARGNIIQKRQLLGTTLDTTSYSYTLADRLQTSVNPDSTTTTYTRDADGRVSSLSVSPPSGAAVTAVSAIAWQPFGPISGYTLGNGQKVARTYDANYRVTDIASPAFTLHVARDAMGNVSAIGAAPGAEPATESYLYDPLQRLSDVIEANGSALESYTYSPTGDRLSKTASGLATGAYLYTTGTHQLTSTGNAVRTNDANGNTTASVVGGNTYGFGYNSRNRLTVAQLNGQTVGTYTYNAMGQRIGKVTSVTERYAYNENYQLLAEYGATNRDYIWLGDLPVAVVDNTVNGSVTTSTINYVTADQLNTPRAVTNSAGTVLWSWAYAGNPFGEQQPTSATGYVLNLRFPGQYYDVETGLVYNGARYFESATGRFLQPDPSGFLGGIGLYVYGLNNPLMYIDPTGLSPPGAPPPIGPFSPEGPPQIPGADDIPSAIPGGPWAPAGPGQPLGRFFGPKQPKGPKAECQWVPREGDGGPPGSVGYWKGKGPGQDWTRYDQGGNVQTPEQAHPNPLPAEPTAEPPPPVETPTVTEPTVVEPPIIEGPIIEGPIIW